jgi:hypothetical protein
VADWAVLGGELGQEFGVRVLVNPLDGLERRVSLGEGFGERLQLRRDGAIWTGEQIVDLVGENAEGASSVPVRVS